MKFTLCKDGFYTKSQPEEGGSRVRVRVRVRDRDGVEDLDGHGDGNGYGYREGKLVSKIECLVSFGRNTARDGLRSAHHKHRI